MKELQWAERELREARARVKEAEYLVKYWKDWKGRAAELSIKVATLET